MLFTETFSSFSCLEESDEYQMPYHATILPCRDCYVSVIEQMNGGALKCLVIFADYGPDHQNGDHILNLCNNN